MFNLGWPWNTFGRKTSAGRTRSQQEAMVICFREKAMQADPRAFPAGCLIRYWPDFADERQRKAYEVATNSPV